MVLKCVLLTFFFCASFTLVNMILSFVSQYAMIQWGMVNSLGVIMAMVQLGLVTERPSIPLMAANGEVSKIKVTLVTRAIGKDMIYLFFLKVTKKYVKFKEVFWCLTRECPHFDSFALT